MGILLWNEVECTPRSGLLYLHSKLRAGVLPHFGLEVMYLPSKPILLLVKKRAHALDYYTQHWNLSRKGILKKAMGYLPGVCISCVHTFARLGLVVSFSAAC